MLPGMEAHAFKPLIPTLKRHVQEDLCEFEVSLVYREFMGSQFYTKKSISENINTFPCVLSSARNSGEDFYTFFYYCNYE